jgi:biotin carboxyl carrier protein
MRRYQVIVNGRSFDVQVLSDPRREQVQVDVDGQSLLVRVKTVAEEEYNGSAQPVPSAAPAVSTVSTPSAKSVTAPLPGVIKSVAARAGQRVAMGDELLVIEAMKMDNVIRAPREGIIEIVHVTEGHRVAHGQPMLDYRE